METQHAAIERSNRTIIRNIWPGSHMDPYDRLIDVDCLTVLVISDRKISSNHFLQMKRMIGYVN